MFQRSQADVEKYLGYWQACFQAVEIHEPESVIPFIHEMEKDRLHVALADLTKGDHTAALPLLRDNLQYEQLRLGGWLPSKTDLDRGIDIDSFNPQEYRDHYILLCQLICVFQPRIFPRTRQDVWRFLQGSLGWVDQLRKLGAKQGDISRFQTKMAFTVVEFENGNNEAAIAALQQFAKPFLEMFKTFPEAQEPLGDKFLDPLHIEQAINEEDPKQKAINFVKVITQLVAAISTHSRLPGV